MRLRHSITAQDDASEALASSFVQQSNSGGNSSNTSSAPSYEVDDFVKEFKESRKVYHKRVMWADKWGKEEVVWRED